MREFIKECKKENFTDITNEATLALINLKIQPTEAFVLIEDILRSESVSVDHKEKVAEICAKLGFRGICSSNLNNIQRWPNPLRKIFNAAEINVQLLFN